MMLPVSSLFVRRMPILAAAAAALCALLVYCRTMAPGLTFIDAGELAAAAATLGIAHPTGYPLFTILGHLVAWIPLGAEPIVRLNAMAAVFCALGVFLTARAAGIVALIVHPELQDKPLLLGAAGAVPGLLLGFTRIYWMQATSVEVYSLHALLVLSVITFCLHALVAREPAVSERLWSLSAFLTGLSFTNHMTTVVMVPGVIFLYITSHGWRPALRGCVARLAVPFLAGLSLYLYLPLRAMESPVMNWGNPVTLERFFWHVSGKQYSVWMFTSGAKALQQLGTFLSDLPRQTGYAGLILALAGIPALWRSSRTVAVALLVMFVVTAGYVANYDIHDIDPYFLLAHIVVALFAGAGLAAALHRWRRAAGLVLLAGSIVAILPLMLHYREVDESANYLVEDYAANMFASLEDDALVLSYQWDYWLSASLYNQLVRGERLDLVVIDKELLRRSWYYRQLERQYPEVVERSRPEIGLFLREIAKFERNLPYSATVLEARYAEVIRGVIERNIGERPVYVTGEIEPQYTAGFQRVPAGLAFRLYADTAFHPTAMLRVRYRPLAREGRLEGALRSLYARAYLARADYYIKSGGEASVVRESLMEAQRFDPAIVRQPGVRRYLP